MDRWVRCWASAIGILASIGMSGCASGPDPEVVRAKAAVQEARADQAVAEYAPEALREAEQALVQAEQGQRQGLDDEEIDHLAYVAEQKAAIAQSQAVEQRSQDQLLQQLRAERTSRGMVVTLEDVLFEVNGSALQPGAQTELLRLADYLKRNPDRNIMIEGHTDNSGARNTTCSSRSCALSRSRAIWSPAACLSIASGPWASARRDEAPNDSATGRQQNRRVEIVILDAGESLAGVAGG